MIFVTGDMHGCKKNFEGIPKLKAFCEKQGDNLNEDDCIIICGDFGFLWHEKHVSELELKLLEGLKPMILFVDGNHENFPLIYSYPVEEWNGGFVHRITPWLLHLMRGQVYQIDGKNIFVMGGGYSVDKCVREKGVTWWPEEMPDEKEYGTALNNLERVRWKVDYVCTHVAPQRIHDLINTGKPHDDLVRFLQEIDGRLEYEQWFFGHYHRDSQVDARHRLLHCDVVSAWKSKAEDGKVD